MSNPFNQRTKTFGQSPVTGGARGRGVQLPVIPFVEDSIFWWDLLDRPLVRTGTIGTDTGPAEPNDTIREVKDKGTGDTKLLRTTFRPEYRVGLGPNGTNFAEFVPGSISLQSNPNPGFGSAVGGITFFAIARRITNTAVNRDAFAWQAQIIREDAASNNWQFNTGGGFVNLGRAITDDEWVYAYVTNDLAGNYQARVSGAARISGVTTYNDVSSNSTIQFGETDVDTAEVAVYNRKFAPSELDELEVYIDGKFGALPIIIP